MSHRNARESLIGARNFPAAVLSQHRRGQSLTLAGANNRDSVSDEKHLDLFSKNRRSLSVTSSDESSDVSVKLGRLSVGSAKISRNGMDDLLSSTDGGKHDYDWLLTPPGTPTMFPSSEGSEPQRTMAAPRGSSLARSASTTKAASRLSVSHSENNHPSRPARSSSVTRSSTSTSMYSTYSSNRPSTILNTSSASVSSYTRPSSPITRSSSTARPSTPSSRPTLSRPSTPSRARPAPTTSSADRSRPGQSSRPSTPSSRPQIPANLSSPAARTSSRSSTPTRRSPAPSLSPASSPSISASRVLANGRSSAPSSRPSSPSPRVRPLPQPVVPLDFPLDTSPNLRTTLPDRPVSAGRSRPGASSVTPRAHSEPAAISNPPRRHSSPIVARGRVTAPEPAGRARLHGNGHISDPEPRKGYHAPDMTMRKPVKSSTVSADGTGFGRTISKKSLDMAIRHMDIRNGSNIRPLSGTTLFPQSIRSVTPKSQPVRGSNSPSSVSINGGLQTSYNGLILENVNGIHRPGENRIDPDGRHSAKLTEVDIHESSRYDAILLKEDLKNTNWLHSIDDKTDPGPIFDHGFESLPEPFGLL